MPKDQHAGQGLFAVEDASAANLEPTVDANAPLAARMRPQTLDEFAGQESILRFTLDAVLAYHTALSLLGVAHSIREEFLVLSEQKHTRPLNYRQTLYRAIQPPAALSKTEGLMAGVEEHNRQGLVVRVTGWERTLVDAFDRLPLAAGWNEAWRSLEAV